MIFIVFILIILMTIIAGLDEAGRGSVIGSLFIACVTMNPEDLKDIPVKDSKKLTEKKREELYKLIKEKAIISVTEVTAKAITELQDSGTNLNKIEVQGFAKCIENISNNKITKYYVDAADIKAERFGISINNELSEPVHIISEHKADDKYAIVSAASIVAKHYREKHVKRLQAKLGDFGSGYPHKKTMDWIRQNQYYGKYVRKNWKGVK
jgi:ribonuclease HII